MSRAVVPVDKAVLTSCVKEVEKSGPLANRSALYEAVALEYNRRQKPTKPLTHSVVYLRIVEWKIEVKTPVGKRGRGVRPSDDQIAKMKAGRSQVKQSKAEKFAKSNTAQDVFKILRERTPERFMPLVDRMEKGSRSAAVKLHCLQCCGYETKEVRQCTALSCPIWVFRPYQKAEEPEESGGEVAVDDE